MTRKPEVCVHGLSIDEGLRLQRMTRTSKSPIRLRRTAIVMAPAQGQAVTDTTQMLATTRRYYARRVVHDFNAKGSGGLDPKASSGPPVLIDTATRQTI